MYNCCLCGSWLTMPGQPCLKQFRCTRIATHAAHVSPPHEPYTSFSQETTLPNITMPLWSRNATRAKPSQFFQVSHTSGCWGWKLHSANSLDFSSSGFSILWKLVSLPIFHFSFEIRHAEWPQ